MNPRGEEPRNRGASGKSSLQDKVATFYYTLGLLCSSYPVYVLIFAFSVIITCCSPLVNLPFPGNPPQQEWISSFNVSSTSHPFCYIQQVVLRVGVLPWESELTLGDAFRAPLYEAFKLLDVVRNYQDKDSGKTLGHVCLHIESVTKSKNDLENVMPQYSCLVLSPANFWHQNVQEFVQDSSILKTIFNHHNFQKGKISISEMLLGIPLFDSGIKRYPLRSRQRIIQYAVTLFLKEYDEKFVEGLREKLTSVYLLHQNETKTASFLNDTVLINYPGEINLAELVPLIISFILLFLYYYFYVRKIEEVKSKIGMAFTVTAAILVSLCMTMGICFFFGLTLNLQEGKGIFPYLAILVGLENVLVLTKSVLTTSLHLDAKIRLAQGLSKEGWSITKNILLEITIFTFGLFTFVPVIQEFCIFAVVSLITDFFIQIFFFLTILGVDLNRMSNSVEKTNQTFRSGLYQPQNFYEKSTQSRGMIRSRSHPRLSVFPTNVVAGPKHNTQEKRIPKRLRIVNIWARTRFFQRSFMFLMVVWICMIVYNSDIINTYVLNVLEQRNEENKNNSNLQKNHTALNFYPLVQQSSSVKQVNYVTYNPLDIENRHQSYDLDKLKHVEYEPWLKLSTRHWYSILRKYNISLSGQTVAILPKIKLSHVISPEEAVLMRNPHEKYGDKFQWEALAAALDPLDFSDDAELVHSTVPKEDRPFYPTSPMEILLTTILCFISVIVLAYTLVVLYRCICSRNYAEWRSSWFPEKNEEPVDEQVLLEAVPSVLEGHKQEIECIATDGINLASTCLGGELKVWDNSTGELLAQIDRKSYFFERTPHEITLDDDALSDYESGSPPSREDSFPRLINKINTTFSFSNPQTSNDPSDVKYQFNKAFRYYYFNHNYSLDARNRRAVKWLKEIKDGNSDSSKTYTREVVPLNKQSDSTRIYSSEVLARIRPSDSGKTYVSEVVARNRQSDSAKIYASEVDPQYRHRDSAEGYVVAQNRRSDSPKTHANELLARNRQGDSSETYVSEVAARNRQIDSVEAYNTSENKQIQLVDYKRTKSDDSSENVLKTYGSTSNRGSNSTNKLSAIWCIDFVENLITIGCANGRIEFWEGTTGKLKCIFEDGKDSGVTHIKVIGSRVIAAHLCGSIDLYQLQSYNQGRPVDWNFTCAYRRTHVRTGSMGSISERDVKHQIESEEDLTCIKLISFKAHQQSITCLDCEGGKILSGSQDHTLKVFRLEDGGPLFTLHGHCGPITCLFIDRINPATSGSGSQDGMLCVWDLLSGACMYSIQAHDGYIVSLTYSASYIISLGIDERLCVWERFQGHLLNTILVGQVFSNQVLMLAPHLAVTGRSGGLVIWDVRSGECVRTISLGRSPFVFINQLILLRDAVLCDYGRQLRIVRFPLITHKFD